MASNDTEAGVSTESVRTSENRSQELNNVVDLTSEATETANTNVHSPTTTPPSNPPSNPPTDPSVKKPNIINTSEDSSNLQPTKPTLVQLGSNSTHPAPHAKRFSAVNINKKFLEKNVSSSGSTPTTSISSSIKSGGVITRPTVQSSTSHPRLITTKLTATPQVSSSPGPGWSRPSSVTPPVAPGSNPTAVNGTTNTPHTSTGNHPSAGPPHPPPPSGKVIQPQPRAAALSVGPRGASNGGISNKSVWGNTKAAASTTRADATDFPTAAEVAKVASVRVSKSAEMKEIEAASKQARLEEADTFRGVHLDPNAHHWDEMEEDDDNFLDGVIEFGDGKQYTVDSTKSPAGETNNLSPQLDKSKEEVFAEDSNSPVSKEERFVDDFDRSWPRNTQGKHTQPSDANNSGVLHSPSQDTSRVLFNERLNRMEPYSSTSRSTTSSQFKRGHQSETSPVESRGPRISTSQSSSSVQLLQKSSASEGFSQSRRYSASQDKHELPRRDSSSSHFPSQNRPLPHSTSHANRFDEQRGRQQSSMGPPPVPPHALRNVGTKESTRQPPPHLSQPLVSPTVERRALSRESRSGVQSSRHPSQSPALSHASIARSPVIDPASLNLSVDELESVKKDLMHTAAARAKQRRQQEEEEREREKERARLKALEIEQRLAVQSEKQKPKELPKEEEPAVQVIEDAIKNVQQSQQPSHPPERHAPQRPPSYRGNSFQGQSGDRTSFTRRTSFSSRNPTMPSATILPSTSTESWRTRTTVSPIEVHSRTPSFATQPPSALEQAQSLAEDPEAELEVVDYSELGKFVGEPEETKASPPAESQVPPKTSRRPVASDFFGDQEDSKAKTDDRVWRRNNKQEPPTTSPLLKSKVLESPSNRVKDVLTHTTDPPLPKDSASSTAAEHHPPPPPPPPPHPVNHRYPRSQPHYKEAALSALDDAMSRIKGALDGMQQAGEKLHHTAGSDAHSKRPVPAISPSKSNKERRVSPPVQLQQPSQEPAEDFLTTSTEGPQTPKPAWNAFVVKLPKLSPALEPVNRKRLLLFEKPTHVRWEVLSFTPHVEGMKRVDFSLNDVLFRRQQYGYGYKGKPRYRVLLPRKGSSSTIKVNIPTPQHSSNKPNLGAFGKPTAADDASTWRKRPTAALESAIVPGLNPTSRSPPPELTEANAATEQMQGDSSSPTQATVALLRPRSEPKMPAGSGVAFVRDSRIMEVDLQPKPAVSFFAVNEPENTQSGSEAMEKTAKPSGANVPSFAPPIGSKIPSLSPDPMSIISSPKYNASPLINGNKTESKSSEDSSDRLPITPPSHHGSSWARTSLGLSKDTPLRVPDPDHLRAVWSQPSSKAELYPVNSLEGIGDDLTALPFTLQDVKSEDGETPPPTAATAPSRMSLHDVTKAFQQVPTSSTLNSHRPTISPPSTSAPVARPTQSYSYSLPNPPPNHNVRPPYSYHPSPMMSHSPAPHPQYHQPHPMNGSPVPSRMPVNGHAPMYSPVWMPHPSSANQSPGGMMRPSMPSPYPQVMYPSPAPQPMYAMLPNMQNTQGPPSGPPNSVGRGRGTGPTMMSPGMPHAGSVPPMSMYPASPVMMQPHVGRPPIRNDSNHHPPISQHLQQPYASVPTPASFSGIRPTW